MIITQENDAKKYAKGAVFKIVFIRLNKVINKKFFLQKTEDF
jgi:hypothetical protein